MVFQPEFKGKRKLMPQIQDSKTERNSYFLLLFSCPVVSDSLWPHTAGPQAFLSLAISRSLWWKTKFMFIAFVMLSSHLILWCPFLLLPSIFPRLRNFSNEHLFASDDQNTGASASASVLPVNIQGVSPIRSTGFIFLLSRGLSNIWVPHGPVKLTITGV